MEVAKLHKGFEAYYTPTFNEAQRRGSSVKVPRISSGKLSYSFKFSSLEDLNNKLKMNKEIWHTVFSMEKGNTGLTLFRAIRVQILDHGSIGLELPLTEGILEKFTLRHHAKTLRTSAYMIKDNHSIWISGGYDFLDRSFVVAELGNASVVKKKVEDGAGTDQAMSLPNAKNPLWEKRYKAMMKMLRSKNIRD